MRFIVVFSCIITLNSVHYHFQVLFVNGNIDPWHALSFTTNTPSYINAIYIQGKFMYLCPCPHLSMVVSYPESLLSFQLYIIFGTLSKGKFAISIEIFPAAVVKKYIGYFLPSQ